MLAFLQLLLAKRAAQYVLAAVALLSLGYCKGQGDADLKHARQEAKDARLWAKEVQDAGDKAYDRALQAASVGAENKEKSNAIRERAAREPGAGDECLSADVVDGLRQLQ